MRIAAHPGEVSTAGREFDICVIGSGPAGITLAVELGRKGLEVLLLEAGGAQFDERSQAMYEGDCFGPLRIPLDVHRLRMFGGSSNHWGGWCRPLDSADFAAKREDMEGAWPITRADLEPFLARARAHVEIGPIAPDEAFGPQLRRLHFAYSPPVRFGEKYRALLESLPNVVVALDACVVDLRERDGRIVEVETRDSGNVAHHFRARRFVLCGGGIENSRLLLWANRRNGGRVVAQADTLGRYWMEHPTFTIGEVLADTDLGLSFDAWHIAWIAPSAEALARSHQMNCALRLMPSGYEGTKALVARLACVAPKLGRWAMERAHRGLVCGLKLRASWEQAPRAWNRVVLGTRTDPFGVPRVDLHWRYSELERETVRDAATMLGEHLVRSGQGRVRLDPWVSGDGEFPQEEPGNGGGHHMGGTRMSRDPRHGVVDADCRVHGMTNLYVAGSSVFPSAGHANPTLTIVQLALRLADHLVAGPR